jgi:hypothetical protein
MARQRKPRRGTIHKLRNFGILRPPVVKAFMARIAKSDEISFLISPKSTSKLDVMNLEGLLAAAMLTTPAVSFEYLFPKFLV